MIVWENCLSGKNIRHLTEISSLFRDEVFQDKVIQFSIYLSLMFTCTLHINVSNYKHYILASIYLFKVKNRNKRKKRWIYSKLTIKAPEKKSMRSFCCFYRWLWTHFTPFPNVSITKIEQVNACWDVEISESFNWFLHNRQRSSHQRCSIRRLFFKISQYSRENTSSGVSCRLQVFRLLSKPVLKNICKRLLLPIPKTSTIE